MFQWNIGSNRGVTTVTLRFASASHVSSTPDIGRRKSPAVIRRDHERLHSWRYDTSYVGKENVCGNKMGLQATNISTCADIGGVTDKDTSHCHVDPHVELVVPNQVEQQNELKQVDHGSEQVVADECAAKCDNISETQTPTIMCETDEINNSEMSFDPAKYFSKVIADFRSEVISTTMRGLTYDDEIVCVRAKPSGPEGFGVLYYEDEPRVYDNYFQLIERFDDQRNSPGWTNQIQVLCREYVEYINEYN